MEKWKFVASTPGRVSHAARRAEKRLKPRAVSAFQTITDAKLVFKATSMTGTSGNIDLSVHANTDSYLVDYPTWNNQPSYDSTAIVTQNTALLAGDIEITGLAALVQGWLDGTHPQRFLLKQANEAVEQDMWGLTDVRLVVTGTPVPEPGAIMAFTASFAMLLKRRRC